MFPKSVVKITCFTDNRSLVETLRTTEVHSDKRLLVDIARIKEMIKENEVNVKWINGREQLADTLTKRGASTEMIDALRM